MLCMIYIPKIAGKVQGHILSKSDTDSMLCGFHVVFVLQLRAVWSRDVCHAVSQQVPIKTFLIECHW